MWFDVIIIVLQAVVIFLLVRGNGARSFAAFRMTDERRQRVTDERQQRVTEGRAWNDMADGAVKAQTPTSEPKVDEYRKYQTLLRNIDIYDGTGRGQIDVE